MGPDARRVRRRRQARRAPGLRRVAQGILDANSDPVDGVPFIIDDTKRAVATAAAMGWSLNVGSGREPATDIWARHFDTPLPDDSQGESGEAS